MPVAQPDQRLRPCCDGQVAAVVHGHAAATGDDEARRRHLKTAGAIEDRLPFAESASSTVPSTTVAAAATPTTAAPTTAAPTTVATAPPTTAAPVTHAVAAPSSTYYANCTAARAAGAAPVHQGDPGYASHLDRDNDGVGCE